MLTVSRTLGGGGAAWIPVATHLISWQSACGILLLNGLLRILAEWARRRTLLAIVLRAPARTEVLQEAGWTGPAMRVIVGPGPDGTSPAQPPRPR